MSKEILDAVRELEVQKGIDADVLLTALEEALGEKLFSRSGRNLVLTEVGRLVYRYANEIFLIGRELTDVLKGRPPGRPIRLTVGVPRRP